MFARTDSSHQMQKQTVSDQTAVMLTAMCCILLMNSVSAVICFAEQSDDLEFLKIRSAKCLETHTKYKCLRAQGRLIIILGFMFIY